MKLIEKDTAHISFAKPAKMAMQIVTDKEAARLWRYIHKAKEKLLGNPSVLDGLFKLTDNHYIIIVKPHQDYLEVVDIINAAVYNPREGFMANTAL